MPAPIAPLRIAAYTVTSAAGVGKATLHAALRTGRSAVLPDRSVDSSAALPGPAAVVVV